MLIDPQGCKLGDKNIKDSDSVARLKEGIRNSVTNRAPNQTILENQKMNMGNPMSPSLFTEKLKKLPGILVEPGGWSNAVAIRRIVLDADPQSPEFGKYVKQYIGGFCTDRVLPEFTSVIPDQWGHPTHEIRGWRNVLLGIHNVGAASLRDLKAVFGDANGQRSEFWKEQTQVR